MNYDTILFKESHPAASKPHLAFEPGLAECLIGPFMNIHLDYLPAFKPVWLIINRSNGEKVY